MPLTTDDRNDPLNMEAVQKTNAAGFWQSIQPFHQATIKYYVYYLWRMIHRINCGWRHAQATITTDL